MASEPMSLNDFPEEILLNILSHFGPEELCLIIAKVCKRWNVLAKDVLLWKTLSYSCDDSSDISRIAEVLTAAPSLHSLNVRNREDVADILEFLNHIHSDLRKLILKRCWLGENSTGLLTHIVALYPDLEVLSLESCYSLTSAGYCLIQRLKKLSELNLSYCQGLSGNTVRLIADSCQHLKRLSLRGGKFDDDDVIHVIKKLGKQLTSLVLIGLKLTDVAYSFLNNCARCIHLKELALRDCYDVTDAGISMVISHCNQLRTLILNGLTQITGEGYLALVPSHLPHLRKLCLVRCNNVCGKYVEELVAAVPELKVIK